MEHVVDTAHRRIDAFAAAHVADDELDRRVGQLDPHQSDIDRAGGKIDDGGPVSRPARENDDLVLAGSGHCVVSARRQSRREQQLAIARQGDDRGLVRIARIEAGGDEDRAGVSEARRADWRSRHGERRAQCREKASPIQHVSLRRCC